MILNSAHIELIGHRLEMAHAIAEALGIDYETVFIVQNQAIETLKVGNDLSKNPYINDPNFRGILIDCVEGSTLLALAFDEFGNAAPYRRYRKAAEDLVRFFECIMPGL